MTGVRGSFGYAQPRMQARLGRQAGVPGLPQMREARTLAAYLQQVRSSPWSRHVARLAPDMDVHDLERRLRDEWRAAVEEVARWQPREWQAALRWLGWLPWLPALQKLARGGRTPAWTREDEVLARVVAATRETRAERLDVTPLYPLRQAVADHDDVAAAWLAHWRGLWPADAVAHAGLEALIAATRGAVRQLASDDAANATELALRTYAHALRRSFRRHPLSATAAVAYLGLVALDLLELRGAASARAALPAIPA